MEACTQCPRSCKIDRVLGKSGFCGVSEDFLVARAALHPWEEPCISGERGSGTLFFCGCNLRCVFCQNREISHEMMGQEISEDALAAVLFSRGEFMPGVGAKELARMFNTDADEIREIWEECCETD